MWYRFGERSYSKQKVDNELLFFFFYLCTSVAAVMDVRILNDFLRNIIFGSGLYWGVCGGKKMTLR